MKGIISTAGLAFGIGVILLGVLAFPPVLVIAVLLIIIGLMADEQ